MNMHGTVCAMCGEKMLQPAASNLHVPPPLVKLMQNSDGHDPNDICGEIVIDLCDDDYEESKDMVSRGETPLPMCDAEYVNIPTHEDAADTAAHLAAMYGTEDADAFAATPNSEHVTENMIQDTLMLMKSVSDDETERIMPHKIHQAKVIFYSLKEMGMIS